MPLADLFTGPENWVKHAARTNNAVCLGQALVDCLSSHHGWRNTRMEAIILRLFPERIKWPFYDCLIVDFNNHPETTFEEIMKVVHEWDREEEAGAPIL